MQVDVSEIVCIVQILIAECKLIHISYFLFIIPEYSDNTKYNFILGQPLHKLTNLHLSISSGL